MGEQIIGAPFLRVWSVSGHAYRCRSGQEKGKPGGWPGGCDQMGITHV